MPSALLIIDVQKDFVPGGALPVPDGNQVIEPINELARSNAFDVVIATRDWHPPHHRSFGSDGGPWPQHCVAGSPGAQLDPRLATDHVDVVIDKGTEPDAEGYSAFENDALPRVLHDERVEKVTIAGLATDYCVRSTALDALAEGLEVTIDSCATRGIDPDTTRRALDELEAAGAEIV